MRKLAFNLHYRAPMKLTIFGKNLTPDDDPHSESGGGKGKTVTLCKYMALALAGLAIGPLAARADDISLQFSFEDSNGLVTGDALFTATPVLSDPGAYLATAGTLHITAPSADDI